MLAAVQYSQNPDSFVNLMDSNPWIPAIIILMVLVILVWLVMKTREHLPD